MSETDMKFCNRYCLVDPNKASFLDLLLLLLFPNLTSERFIDSSPDKLKSSGRSFASRWIIALAVLVQKLLIILRKPLAFIGRILTYWLNLLTTNGGFFNLILHLITGNLVKPEESSPTYTSFLGCSDRRVELDEKINFSTIEYKSMLSMMASKIAYENKSFITSVVKNTWKMDFVGYYDFYNAYQERNLTEAFVFKTSNTNPNLIVVSFRTLIINACEDAPNPNYFSLLWLIPNLLNGVWEFIRSFIIQFWKGKEYKENWMMRLIRIVGILVPGISNHFPCDYVNSTRLGGLARPSSTTHEDKIAFIA